MSSFRQLRRRSAGFTLVEMIVVMAVLGLVFAVTLAARPKASGVRMEALSRSLVASLRLARDDAMMRNVETSFVIDGTARIFGRPGATTQIPADVAMQVTAADEARRRTGAGFVFYPDGRSSGGTIVLAAGRARTTIDVDWLTGLAMVRR